VQGRLSLPFGEMYEREPSASAVDVKVKQVNTKPIAMTVSLVIFIFYILSRTICIRAFKQAQL
jgi:hypothetical protein